MKVLHKKMGYMAVVMAVGIVLWIVGVLQTSDSVMVSLGIGLAVIGLLKLLQFFRISRNPDRVREFEVVQNEERLVMISTKSGYFAFLLMLLAEFAAIVVLAFMAQLQLAAIVCYIAGGQTLLYLVVYLLLSRKY